MQTPGAKTRFPVWCMILIPDLVISSLVLPRCWPQAERLKALVALNSNGIIKNQEIVEQQISLIFSHFLETSQSNPWVDKIDEDGSVIDARPAPSSRYHLYVGFYEYLQTETPISIRSVAS